MKTAHTHTAGPWKTWIGNPWNDDNGNRQLVSTEDGERTIAHILNAGDIDECEACGRLIAAAPDLLAELRECAAGLAALIEERPILGAKLAGSTTLGNRLAQARAAIAKATD